jgi:hypothetical protein
MHQSPIILRPPLKSGEKISKLIVPSTSAFNDPAARRVSPAAWGTFATMAEVGCNVAFGPQSARTSLDSNGTVGLPFCGHISERKPASSGLHFAKIRLSRSPQHPQPRHNPSRPPQPFHTGPRGRPARPHHRNRRRGRLHRDMRLPMPVQRRLRNRVITGDVPVRVARREGLIYGLALRMGAYCTRPTHAETLPCPD